MFEKLTTEYNPELINNTANVIRNSEDISELVTKSGRPCAETLFSRLDIISKYAKLTIRNYFRKFVTKKNHEAA